MTNESSLPPKKSARSRAVSLIIKIGITALCFWYITTKIDFGKALAALTKANLFYLAVALVFFVLSKLLSAVRLNIYFRNIGLDLSAGTNNRLYWLGMFYNLFLPGAISGDAYKVVLLNRRYRTPYKKASAAVLLDRFSGVVALGIILAAYGIVVVHNPKYDVLLLAGAVLGFAGFYVAVRFVLKDFLPGFFPTFFWGLAVQLSQVVCIYFILFSLNLTPQPEWIFIFLASAVISVLPISLGGGLGTRELVFATGSNFFHFDPQLGVVVSLLFYLITVAGSLPGLYYTFHNPLPSAPLSHPDSNPNPPNTTNSSPHPTNP